MYQIKLPVFEGPFDLLLYLIRKHEIDIYDIPIANITREYLEYIDLMQILDLEVAGEFIEMVATLILIKTRMLLPNPPTDEADDMEDPRLQLTLQLLQYKRFKEAGQHLQEIETVRREYVARDVSAIKKVIRTQQAEQQEDDFEVDATLFDLMTAFKRALDNMPRVTVHEVKTYNVSLEDQIGLIIDRLSDTGQVFFHELTRGMTERIYLVVTFMAILDLMRANMISAKQSGPYEDIRLVAIGDVSMSRWLHEREGTIPEGGATDAAEGGATDAAEGGAGE